jgi:hypothetical protein
LRAFGNDRPKHIGCFAADEVIMGPGFRSPRAIGYFRRPVKVDCPFMPGKRAFLCQGRYIIVGNPFVPGNWAEAFGEVAAAVR